MDLGIFFSFYSGIEVTLNHHTTTNECGATEELEPIDKNLGYDFNYQVLKCYSIGLASVFVQTDYRRSGNFHWHNVLIVKFLCSPIFDTRLSS